MSPSRARSLALSPTTSKRLLRRLSLAMLTGRRLALLARYAQNISHPRGGEEGIQMQPFVTVRKIAKVCLLHFLKLSTEKSGTTLTVNPSLNAKTK